LQNFFETQHIVSFFLLKIPYKVFKNIFATEPV